MIRQIRVVQCGLGPIGAAIVRLMSGKQQLVISSAVDIDREKVGKDLGQVCGMGRDLGVLVTHDVRAALSSRPDVVVHSTSSSLNNVAGQLLECLQARAHIVSTCEELAYPYRKNPELSKKLDSCARQHEVALLGIGVNPGFAMDKLVLTMAAACHQVKNVRVHRVVDASQRRLPLQKKVGAGLTVEEFQSRVAQGIIKHHGLPESLAMIADSLGLGIDHIRESIEPVVATEAFRSDSLEIPGGYVLGIHQVAYCESKGNENVRLELEMYVGAPKPMDAIVIDGIPKLEMTIPGGIHGDLAAVALAVNSIPAVLDVKPGLRTSRDMPLCYFPSELGVG